MSFMRSGATLPMVEMTPTPPSSMMSRVDESSPEYTSKPAGALSMMYLICSKLPEASLMATTLSQLWAKRRVVSPSMLIEQRPGMLYRMMGMSVESAMVLKWRYRPSCGGLL